MGKIAPTLEIRLPTGDIDKRWLEGFLLTLRRQHEEIARVINHQHGVDVAFLARNSVLQGPFSAETTINFATESFDLQEDYDGVNKFTAPADGIYHIGAQVRLLGMTAGDVFVLRIKKNVTVTSFFDLYEVPAAALQNIFKIHSLLQLDAGDDITITGARSSGTGTASVDSNPDATFFYGRAEIIIPAL